MSRIIRSAMLQMRVSLEIKLASEHVLRRIGLNLTEATELFLRRMWRGGVAFGSRRGGVEDWHLGSLSDKHKKPAHLAMVTGFILKYGQCSWCDQYNVDERGNKYLFY